jgi:hypothetical protein
MLEMTRVLSKSMPEKPHWSRRRLNTKYFTQYYSFWDVAPSSLVGVDVSEVRTDSIIRAMSNTH